MSENKSNGTSNKNSFPDINNIQYGSPTIKNSQRKSTEKKKTVTTTKRIASQSKVSVSSSAKTNEPAKKTANSNKQSVSSKPAPAHKTVKTREQLEEEKRLILEKKRKSELEAKRRKELERQEKERRAKEFNIFIKKASQFLINACFGVVTAIIIGFLIFVIYSRVITSYNSEIASTQYSFYAYIDPEDETQSAIAKREAREKGEESAKVTFKKKHKVINDVAYLPISQLTDFFKLSISGDGNVRTVSITGDSGKQTVENSAVFTNGSMDIVVNGAIHTLENTPIFENGDVYVPLEFFERYVEGLSYSKEKELFSTTVKIILEAPTITFKGASDKIIEVPQIQDYVTTAQSEYNYKFDMTPYEQYINPADPNKYLTLINLDNRLQSSYEPEDLIDVIHTRKTRAVKERMRLDAAKALEAFLGAAATEGITDVSVTSGYRTYAYQNQLFTQRVNQKMATGAYASRADSEKEIAKFTMYPGASEHQSGLCVDMHNQPSAMQVFAQTESYSWLYKHCADFGFILRYPQNKEGITGVSFEPWHFRFVGRYHAQKIMESGLCLEEYIAQLEE